MYRNTLIPYTDYVTGNYNAKPSIYKLLKLTVIHKLLVISTISAIIIWLCLMNWSSTSNAFTTYAIQPIVFKCCAPQMKIIVLRTSNGDHRAAHLGWRSSCWAQFNHRWAYKCVFRRCYLTNITFTWISIKLPVQPGVTMRCGSTQVRYTRTELLGFATGQLPANNPLRAAIWTTFTLHGLWDRPTNTKRHQSRDTQAEANHHCDWKQVQCPPGQNWTDSFSESPLPILNAICWSCAQPSGLSQPVLQMMQHSRTIVYLRWSLSLDISRTTTSLHCFCQISGQLNQYDRWTV